MLAKNILDEIERWQESTYAASGRTPESISSEIDQLESDYKILTAKGPNWKQALESIIAKSLTHNTGDESVKEAYRESAYKSWSKSLADPQVQERIEHLFKRWRTTKYQDPIILGGIASDWDAALQTAGALWPEKFNGFRSDEVCWVNVCICHDCVDIASPF